MSSGRRLALYRCLFAVYVWVCISTCIYICIHIYIYIDSVLQRLHEQPSTFQLFCQFCYHVYLCPTNGEANRMRTGCLLCPWFSQTLDFCGFVVHFLDEPTASTLMSVCSCVFGPRAASTLMSVCSCVFGPPSQGPRSQTLRSQNM